MAGWWVNSITRNVFVYRDVGLMMQNWLADRTFLSFPGSHSLRMRARIHGLQRCKALISGIS
jgi:hypothetical protein